MRQPFIHSSASSFALPHHFADAVKKLPVFHRCNKAIQPQQKQTFIPNKPLRMNGFQLRRLSHPL